MMIIIILRILSVFVYWCYSSDSWRDWAAQLHAWVSGIVLAGSLSLKTSPTAALHLAHENEIWEF